MARGRKAAALCSACQERGPTGTSHVMRRSDRAGHPAPIHPTGALELRHTRVSQGSAPKIRPCWRWCMPIKAWRRASTSAPPADPPPPPVSLSVPLRHPNPRKPTAPEACPRTRQPPSLFSLAWLTFVWALPDITRHSCCLPGHDTHSTRFDRTTRGHAQPQHEIGTDHRPTSYLTVVAQGEPASSRCGGESWPWWVWRRRARGGGYDLDRTPTMPAIPRPPPRARPS